jgi:hypothetical protein
MAADSDLVTLHAEILAVQAALIAVSRRLAVTHPELGPAFCAAFEDAETIMSGLALRLDLPSDSTLEALRILAEMRDAVIQDEALCRAGGDGGSRR